MSGSSGEAGTYKPGMSAEEFARAYGEGAVTKLGSNESPFPPPEGVISAIAEAAAGINRYPPVTDENLLDRLAALHGVPSAGIVSGNGGADVLSMIAYAFLDRQSACIVSRPAFPVYEMTARRQGARIDYVDLDPASFAPDVPGIVDAVRPETRVVYLCSPNNPTGTLFPRESIVELLSRLDRSVLVVADEVYMPFADTDNSVALLSSHENLLVLQSFSKVRGLAGARVGYALGSPGIVEQIAAHRLPFHTNSLGLTAALSSMDEPEHMESLISHVKQSRDRVVSSIRELGYRVWDSHANFYCLQLPEQAEQFREELMKRRIIVRPLEGFSLPGHIRITIGTDEENARVLTALEELR